MKTKEKAETSEKAVKTSTARKSRAKKEKTITDEDIRQKAREIYEQRMAHGEPGDSLQDWLEAEKSLKNS
jgi:hypothetical protein